MFNLFKNRCEIEFVKKKVSQLQNSEMKEFFLKNLKSDCSYISREKLKKQKNPYRTLMDTRSVSTFRLKMEIPHKFMFKEAQALKTSFVPHREDPNYGWKALCLHGAAPEETNDYRDYGYKNLTEANYHWTEIAEKCPQTVSWLKNNWKYGEFHRVRFVLLEPGGYITPHNDTNGERGFFAINVALNQPFGCLMLMENFGIVPWRSGDIRFMDIGLRHSVYNFSNEDRYHMIIHGAAGDQLDAYKKMVVNAI